MSTEVKCDAAFILTRAYQFCWLRQYPIILSRCVLARILQDICSTYFHQVSLKCIRAWTINSARYAPYNITHSYHGSIGETQMYIQNRALLSRSPHPHQM